MKPNEIVIQNAPVGTFLVAKMEVEPLDIEQFIRETAIEYGVDPDDAVKVAECESHLRPDVQSFHVSKDGTREDSWGLWQIHLPSHPTVTREMALDPIWSTHWSMKHISEGRWWMWTCARIEGVI